LTSERAAIVTSGVARFELEPHNCFACGALNEHGLNLVIHCEPGRAWTELGLERRFEGWDGVAHGGIVTTILDEGVAWSLIAEDTWGVTARLSVDFKRPVPVGRPIRALGELVRARRRLFDTRATLVDADGTPLAVATALYVAAPADRKEAMRERYGVRLVADDEADGQRSEADDAPGPGDGA
jgi:acyl-coenzyme A thioesterase PaaI-like protein